MREGTDEGSGLHGTPGAPPCPFSPQAPERLKWPPLVVVGLTGGIASGKSTLAGYLEELGAVVLPADRIGHDVAAPGQPALAELTAAFGAEFLGPDGSLDRAALARRVFGDPAAMRVLNRITHPRIRVALEARLRQLQRRPPRSRIVVVEAAVLIEAGWQSAVDRVVVVAVQPSTQVHRLTAGLGLTPEEASARLASQLTNAQRLRHADHRVDGEGTTTEVMSRAGELFRALNRLATMNPSP